MSEFLCAPSFTLFANYVVLESFTLDSHVFYFSSVSSLLQQSVKAPSFQLYRDQCIHTSDWIKAALSDVCVITHSLNSILFNQFSCYELVLPACRLLNALSNFKLFLSLTAHCHYGIIQDCGFIPQWYPRYPNVIQLHPQGCQTSKVQFCLKNHVLEPAEFLNTKNLGNVVYS